MQIIRNQKSNVNNQNIVLANFYNQLPDKVLFTDELSHGLRILPKEYTTARIYVGLNQLYRHYIPIDLDRPDSLYAFRKAGIPQPTIMTVNKDNGHAHYLYALNKPVIFTDKSRLHPQEYFKEITESLEFQLDADPNFVGLITKNPLSNFWHTETNDVSFDLKDFKEYILNRLPKQFRKRNPINRIINNPSGRNCTVFDTVRFFAYNQVKFCDSQSELLSKVIQLALDLNSQFDTPLPIRELQDTAKSVSKWTYQRKEFFYERRYKNRGIMGLGDSNLTLKEKQQKGAKYSASIKANATKDKITNAIAELLRSGKKATQREIAAHTGLNLETVNRHLKK